MGSLSDKTKTKKFGGGRRRPWMVTMAIPLSLVMYFLFTPPGGQVQTGENPAWAIAYFMIIICVFDTIYTTYSVSRTALYPEMFRTDKAREKAGAVQRILMVIALLVAFVLPTLIIEDMTLKNSSNYESTLWQYQLTGIIFGVIVLISILINVFWGTKELPVDELEKKETMSIFKSIKESLSNKKFVIFALCSTMNWYVFGLLPTIMPIYIKTVIDFDTDPVVLYFVSKGIPADLLISIPLVIAFLTSILGIVFWMFVDRKLGSKLAFILSMGLWAAVLLPLIFINNYLWVLVIMALNGIGLGGSPYFIDRHISNITDDDEIRTGQRREGSYYGVHALFVRLSTILSIGSIAIVLSTNGWTVYEPEVVISQLIFGLKSLVSLFPAGALIIGIVILLFFPLNRTEVAEMQQKLKT